MMQINLKYIRNTMYSNNFVLFMVCGHTVCEGSPPLYIFRRNHCGLLINMVSSQNLKTSPNVFWWQHTWQPLWTDSLVQQLFHLLDLTRTCIYLLIMIDWVYSYVWWSQRPFSLFLLLWKKMKRKKEQKVLPKCELYWSKCPWIYLFRAVSCVMSIGLRQEEDKLVTWHV